MVSLVAAKTGFSFHDFEYSTNMLVSNKIRKVVVKALATYSMVREGDRVLVAVSGGIDSSVLLASLIDIQRKAPFSFDIQPVLVDHKFPDIKTNEFQQWITGLGCSLRILDCDTYSLVTEAQSRGDSPCQICSRLRRGTLYTFARKHGYNKIALGHNRDDFNETVLLNMFYSGKIAGMSPKYLTNDKANIIIRPLCLLPKDPIREQSDQLEVPVVRNNFCEGMPDNSRYRIRDLLKQLDQESSAIGQNLLASQGNIRPNLLMDRNLWDFEYPE